MIPEQYKDIRSSACFESPKKDEMDSFLLLLGEVEGRELKAQVGIRPCLGARLLQSNVHGPKKEHAGRVPKLGSDTLR